MSLSWDRGAVGSIPTYTAAATADGARYRIVIDKPYRAVWILRTWSSGKMIRYREFATLKAAKAYAEEFIDSPGI